MVGGGGLEGGRGGSEVVEGGYTYDHIFDWRGDVMVELLECGFKVVRIMDSLSLLRQIGNPVDAVFWEFWSWC